MQIDILWLRTWFARFNAQYFDGVLPTPHFRIGHSRTRLGSLSYKRKSRFGRTHYFDFTLGLSNYYNQTEHQFQNVLLHEMIHLSIACSGVEDTSPHGLMFRGMMQRLNRDGWNIQVTTTTRGMEKSYTGSSNVIRQYLVLAIKMKDGRTFLSSVNPKFARQLHRQLPAIHDISHFTWYTTDDRWFENMPKVRSLRGRRVAQDVFAEKTGSMTPFTM